MSDTSKKAHYRIIDANLNRLREGIRVVEDIIRYALNDQSLSLQLKAIRHDSIIEDTLAYLSARAVESDCLKDISTSTEMNRASITHLMISNVKRAQESARVLEEIFKLYEPKYSGQFKDIRYRLYAVEKEIFQSGNLGEG